MVEQSAIGRFFDSYIEGWMLKDLRYCAQVKEENLSFVVANSVFDAVDFLSKFWAPKGPKKRRFEGFLRTFFKSGYTGKELYDNYRSGLSHEYFPKRGNAVTWRRPEDHLQVKNGRLCLNAQDLVSDLVEAVARYREALRNENLRNNFEIHAKELGFDLERLQVAGEVYVGSQSPSSSSSSLQPVKTVRIS